MDDIDIFDVVDRRWEACDLEIMILSVVFDTIEELRVELRFNFFFSGFLYISRMDYLTIWNLAIF